MIKELCVENFLSIGHPQVFKMNTKHSLNIIYGENGSGKTNIITVLLFLKHLIEGENTYNSSVYNNVFYPESDETKIEIIFDIDNVEYTYYVAFQNDEKIEEALSRSEEEVFNLKDNFYSSFFSESEISRLKTYKLNKRSIIEILEREFTLCDDALSMWITSVFTFFTETIQVLNEFNQNKFGKVFEDLNTQKKKAEFLELCTIFNLPVYDVQIHKSVEELSSKMRELQRLFGEEDKIQETRERYTVNIVHQNNKEISYDLESNGTKKLLSYFLQILQSKESIFIDDEIESSLHYEASKALLFRLKDSVKQVIVTTHCLEYLEIQDFGKETFYFVEKNEKECTTIQSLAEYKEIRKDARHNWKKMYQNYRFTGYPKKIATNSNK